MRNVYAVTAVVVVLACTGCGATGTLPGQDGQMVYVDTETFHPVVAPVSEVVPTLNPATGKRTLMPGLYCSDCKKWYPAPSPSQINRQPGAALCPRTNTPMIADGPWPEGVTVSGGGQ